MCRNAVGIRQLVRKRDVVLESEVADQSTSTEKTSLDEAFTYVTEDGKEVNLKSSKLQALLTELEATRSTKSVIFSQFTMYLDLIEVVLTKNKFKFVRLDGTMSQNQRKVAIETFNTDPSVTIFLMSLKAGGVGLNLTTGKQVFILDPVTQKF